MRARRLNSARLRGFFIAFVLSALVSVGLTACQAPSDSPPTVTSASGSTVSSVATPIAHAPALGKLDSFTTQLGAVYNVEPSKKTVGLRVSFPVTSDDLRAINGYRPSTANLFIAVWEPVLKMWVPLATTYNASTHTISATAPHFSNFLKGVVSKATSVAKSVGRGVASAVTGLVALAASARDSLQESISDSFGKSQKGDDCASKVNKAYTFSVGTTDLSGCIEGTISQREFDVENDSDAPMSLFLPHSARVTIDPANYNSLADILAAGDERIADVLYMPAHKPGTADVSSVNQEWSGTAQYDPIGIIYAVIVGVFSLYPGFVDDEVPLLTALRGQFAEAQGGNVDKAIATAFSGAGAGFAAAFSSAVSCASGLRTLASTVKGNGSALTAVFNAAKGCADDALDAATSLGESVKSVLSALNTIPDLVKTTLAFGKFASVVRAFHAIGQYEVTYDPLADEPTTSSTPTASGGLGDITGFVMPNGQLRCAVLTGDGNQGTWNVGCKDTNPDFTPTNLPCASFPNVPPGEDILMTSSQDPDRKAAGLSTLVTYGCLPAPGAFDWKFSSEVQLSGPATFTMGGWLTCTVTDPDMSCKDDSGRGVVLSGGSLYTYH